VHQTGPSLARKPDHLAPDSRGVFLNEVVRKQRNVLPALA